MTREQALANLHAIIILALIFLGMLCVLALVSIFHEKYKQRKTEQRLDEEFVHFRLKRYEGNPILSPREEHAHETIAAFNPAVFQDEFGTVHMLYRAMGADGVSRLGYSTSRDGLHFEGRLSSPAFQFEYLPEENKRYDPVMYPSGGSWGGAEDPRMVEIDGRVYVTMSAFDNWNNIRMAAISIKADDMRALAFKNWSRPLFLSPAGQVQKNWVLFPEKIGGKFAILHSLSPEVAVDYVDRLEDLDSGKVRIESLRSNVPTKDYMWESWIRGAGPSPIRIPEGWLVLYHAIDKNDPDRYKLGALLLDAKNPATILARTPKPILSPDMWYENDGKPGVVYACGAIVRDGTLFVYYGGGDKHCAVATAPLSELLEQMK